MKFRKMNNLTYAGVIINYAIGAIIIIMAIISLSTGDWMTNHMNTVHDNAGISREVTDFMITFRKVMMIIGLCYSSIIITLTFLFHIEKFNNQMLLGIASILMMVVGGVFILVGNNSKTISQIDKPIA